MHDVVGQSREGMNYTVNGMNDVAFLLTGYIVGHFIGCDYNYKHRVYVRERVFHEQRIQWQGR